MRLSESKKLLELILGITDRATLSALHQQALSAQPLLLHNKFQGVPSDIACRLPAHSPIDALPETVPLSLQGASQALSPSSCM